MMALIYGNEYNDHQLFNMGVICVLDFICEQWVYIFPSWYHRHLLLIDSFIKLQYTYEELWDAKIIDYLKNYQSNIDQFAEEEGKLSCMNKKGENEICECCCCKLTQQLYLSGRCMS